MNNETKTLDQAAVNMAAGYVVDNLEMCQSWADMLTVANRAQSELIDLYAQMVRNRGTATIQSHQLDHLADLAFTAAVMLDLLQPFDEMTEKAEAME